MQIRRQLAVTELAGTFATCTRTKVGQSCVGQVRLMFCVVSVGGTARVKCGESLPRFFFVRAAQPDSLAATSAWGSRRVWLVQHWSCVFPHLERKQRRHSFDTEYTANLFWTLSLFECPVDSAEERQARDPLRRARSVAEFGLCHAQLRSQRCQRRRRCRLSHR